MWTVKIENCSRSRNLFHAYEYNMIVTIWCNYVTETSGWSRFHSNAWYYLYRKFGYWQHYWGKLFSLSCVLYQRVPVLLTYLIRSGRFICCKSLTSYISTLSSSYLIFSFYYTSYRLQWNSHLFLEPTSITWR